MHSAMQSVETVNSMKGIRMYLPKCHKSYKASVEYAGFAQGLQLIGVTFSCLAFHPQKFSLFAEHAQRDLFVGFFYIKHNKIYDLFFFFFLSQIIS